MKFSTVALASASILAQLAAAKPLPPMPAGVEALEVELHPKARNAVLQLEERATTPVSSNTGPSASNKTNGLPYPVNDPSHVPQPIRDNLGAAIVGPQNPYVQQENPDFLAPPTTDHGSIPSAKWPFALSHNKVSQGGWARQQTQFQLPVATAMAGVNMRLTAGSYRELHWHTASEWAFVLKGSVIVNAVNYEGQNYIAKTNPGDLWYFPAGTPHVLQATDDDADGAEFLLVFDTGAFDEDSTFLLSDWLAHVPKGILNKNFGFNENSSAFGNIPANQLYIFTAPLPAPVDEEAVKSPHGVVPKPFTFPFSQQKPQVLEGGSVKVVDSSSFKVSETIAAALVTVEPGAIRELHWHPNSDEWAYYLNGTMRVGIFGANSNAATIDFEPGDVGYITQNSGTYAECVSNTTCSFLEVFKSDHYADIALNQWLALTPVEVVADHLRVSTDTIHEFKKEKPIVAKGNKSVTK